MLQTDIKKDKQHYKIIKLCKKKIEDTSIMEL